jgi:hypothetical protein
MADVTSAGPEQVTLARLDDQISWYSRKSGTNQRRFKVLKATTIISAALIPVATTAGGLAGARVAAGLGVLIAIVEGLQQMNQYYANWSAYRATAEALKHEKFLYLAQAGAYANPATARNVLAERIETLISEENAKWFVTRRQDLDKPDTPR